MFHSIWLALSNTPFWVYVLFVFLVFIGISAAKPQQVMLKKLFILPIVFTYMSVEMLISHIQLNVFSVCTFILAIFIGVFFGWWQIQRLNIRVNKEKKSFTVPGTWSTLVIILIIFFSKYCFGYTLAIDPGLAQNTWYELSMLMVSGICSGLFIGRLFNYLYRLKYAPLKLSKAHL